MKQKFVSHGTGRRKFFKNAALLGGAAVLSVFGRRAKANPSTTLPAKPREKGYRLTAHVRKYYEKASF
jgi:hypothetical protein